MSLTQRTRNQKNLVLYFQVHQPRRLSPINFFDLGNDPHYFNDDLNRSIVERVSRDCYLPANKLLLEVIRHHPEVKITFSLSGVVIDQFEAYAVSPAVGSVRNNSPDLVRPLPVEPGSEQ